VSFKLGFGINQPKTRKRGWKYKNIPEDESTMYWTDLPKDRWTGL